MFLRSIKKKYFYKNKKTDPPSWFPYPLFVVWFRVQRLSFMIQPNRTGGDAGPAPDGTSALHRPNRAFRPTGPALVAPSLLAADFANLQRDVELINRSEADYLHFDVMDGVFVPNISFGFPVLKAVRQYCQKPLDVHLMITDPDRYIDAFADGGAAVIHVHLEVCPHLHRTLTHIHEAGCRAGVALNPHTPVSGLADVLEQIDVILIMSVNPGFGGQSFIPHTLRKIAGLKQFLLETQSSALIEVDGGVGTDNAASLLSAGADILVAGNSVFGADEPLAAIRQLKNSYQSPMA